jgi:hypothetical protein
MKVQVLTSPGCDHGERTAELVELVVRECAPAAEVERITVATGQDAARLAFPGSPTVRVDGIDLEPDAPRAVGLG